MSKNIHNTINNIEFPAKDLSKLKEFYGEVFGWQFKSYGDDYLEFNDGNMLGGFNRKLDSNRDGVLIIIYSEDLDKTQSLIEANGGFSTSFNFNFRVPKGIFFIRSRSEMLNSAKYPNPFSLSIVSAITGCIFSAHE